MSVSYRNNTTGLLERAAGYSDTDAVLSPISRNPIQNKAVYDALAQKIEKTVADLENYYNTSQTYNKQEVRELIGSINTLTIEVVATLPTEDISSTTIYFVGPKAGTSTYDEYVYVNNAWVQIGDTEIDLSNYVTSADLTTVLQSYYTKTQTDNLFNDYYDKDTVDNLLDLKQDVLTFDNSPTSGSANPVTSNGIRTAINNAIVSSAGGSIIKVHHLDGSVVAGDTVTASKGSFSVSTTFDNNGDAIITGVGEIGIIQIMATNGTDIGVAFISTPSFSLYSTTISYGVNYKSWLEAGGLNPSSYSSLDEILEDEEAIRRLFTIHASVDYLAAAIITDDNEDAIKIFNNDLCAKWISLRDYAMDTLPTNEHIATMMEDADKYGYGEWVLMPQVPTMTSNTAPYGTVIYGSQNSNDYTGYKAFDNNNTTKWLSESDNVPNMWIGYHFPHPTTVNVIEYQQAAISADGLVDTTATVQYSDDGTTWQGTEIIQLHASDGYSLIRKYLTTPITAEYIRLKLTSHNRYYAPTGPTAGRAGCFATLQFYAWQPKGNVPVMTSNTAPYGTVTVSSSHSSIGTSWKAFDNDVTSGWMANTYANAYIAYNFINPICIKGVEICNYAYDALGQQYARIKNFIIQGSNDNTNWDSLYSGVYSNDSDQRTIPQFFEFENIDYYTSYRLYINDVWQSDQEYIGVSYLQFYGREMKASVPTMTSNTTPCGEVIYGTQQDTYQAWRAFDKIVPTLTDASNSWYSALSLNDYIGYDFGHKIYLKWVSFRARSVNTNNTIKNYVIQGSDTGMTNDWHDILEDTYPSTSSNDFIIQSIDAEYRFFRLFIKDSYNGLNICVQEMYLFGFDYSERDWDTEHPMKYIYDHGVELEPVTGYVNSSSSANAVEKRSSELYVTCGSGAASGTQFTGFFVSGVDLTDYSIMKVQLGTELKDGGSSRFGFMGAGPGTAGSTQASANITARFPMCLDISSVMGNSNMIYPVVNTGNEKLSVNEWWLEE